MQIIRGTLRWWWKHNLKRCPETTQFKVLKNVDEKFHLYKIVRKQYWEEKNRTLHSLPDIATRFLISFSKMFNYSFIMFWSQSTKWQVRILHFPPKYYWNILWCRKEYERIQSWLTSQDTVFTWCLTDTLSPEKLSVQMPLHGCLATRIRTKQIQK